MTVKNRDRLAGVDEIAGVILAGGLSRRMGGGDKTLCPLGGRPLLAHVVERVKPQVAVLALNANGDPGRFSAFGLPIVADAVPGFAGPLAGVLAGLEWAAARGFHWLASFAGDTPFLPADLTLRLMAAAAAAGAPLALAASGGRLHPVSGLWSAALATDLRRALIEEGVRKVDLWAARHGPARAGFAIQPFDPFFNINSPDDLAAAERLLPVADNPGRRP
jgi:molybdopterin-guanine dinucleotide biosynthesis protein A